MISQSGTFYKIIVTSCVLLGVDKFYLSNASPVAIKANAATDPASISHASFNLQFPPSAPTGAGLYFTTGDIAAAESSSLFGDGAVVAHPLHGLLSGGGLNLLNVGTEGSQYLQAIVAPQQSSLDDLQTAGQSYFIEPPAPTTTTQKPTFKKRKTRRPISSLAEKSRKAKAAEAENSGNNGNNDIFQGNPVPFNPFRQIVNTSFGRKRPSGNKQGRPRSRANAVKQETGSVDAKNNEQKGVDNINEISRTEGEPRVLGRRKPAQDVRPIRPTTTDAAGDDSNTDGPPKGRRFPLRKPRPSFDGPTGPVEDNGDQKPLRPRLVKRPRPRPTTTIAAPLTETDTPTETTDPVTVSHPILSTQPAPAPALEARPKVRPAVPRPLGINRFANNANRNTGTTTPSTSDSGDETPLPSLPPSNPRRRPLRPTTRQQSLTTESPEDILGNTVGEDVPKARGTARGRVDGIQNPVREGRQGFLLRPRPTANIPKADTAGNVAEPGVQNEVGVRRLSNRRRKRPTTTLASPISSAISYNQEFTGGIVESNVQIPSSPARERLVPGRRAQGLRSRPTPLPATGGPPAYQIREEQPVPQPVDQSRNFRNPTGVGEFVSFQQGNPSPMTGPSHFRRPAGPAIQSPVAPLTPLQQTFNNNAAFVDPNNFVNPNSNLFRFPSQDNFSFYPGGFDNAIGVPSNFKAIQHIPGANEFSSRSTSTADEPEISHSDFAPSASTEKQSISPSNSNTEIADAPVSPSKGDEENKQQEDEQSKKAASVKLSPLERLHQNRQAAARRLLSPRKPTEKTTVAPTAANQKANNFRKSIIPPRMLRPRGKLPGATAAPPQQQEQSVPNDGGENDSGAVEEKPDNNKEVGGTNAEIINDSASSAVETTDKESNTIPISPNPKEEEKTTTSTRKPSLLEAAKRRRASSILAKNSANSIAPQQQQQQQPKPKITPPPPPAPANHDPEASQPTCEDGQRYSKFLKRCVAMYKPKSQG